MLSETYELIAQFLRYWFVFLMVMITFRAVRWLMNERRAYKKTLRALPDAGSIGELVDTDTGKNYPLPREGVISPGRFADIRLKKMKPQRIHFLFIEGVGVRLNTARRKNHLFLDDQMLGKEGVALHGSYLDIAPYHLRFRLFAGLDVPSRQTNAAVEEEAHLLQEVDPWAGYAYAPLEQQHTWPYAMNPSIMEAEHSSQHGQQAAYIPPETYDTGYHSPRKRRAEHGEE